MAFSSNCKAKGDKPKFSGQPFAVVCMRMVPMGTSEYVVPTGGTVGKDQEYMALVDGVPAGSTKASKAPHHPQWLFPVCGQNVRAQLCLLPCSLPVPLDLEKPIKGFLTEISLIMVLYHGIRKVRCQGTRQDCVLETEK